MSKPVTPAPSTAELMHRTLEQFNAVAAAGARIVERDGLKFVHDNERPERTDAFFGTTGVYS